MGLLGTYFYGIRLQINHIMMNRHDSEFFFILRMFRSYPQYTFFQPGSMVTSNVFLTGRKGHATKLILWDYRLTGQLTVPLEKYPRKNAAKHTTDISNNSHLNHDTNHKLLWS